ncbi:hypothetical protein LAZ67_1000063 [Cordylochernes scorpioides]|uniref:Ig-like domain-containing protein n=1 Tax=Cordylochernes scorpioides TaxID=51811 RepID=A0ABY6JWY0_9ARAC|nr:hypothetical protein LAZ67_1000063 [Cordylochernes scorpioides]
MCAGKSQPFIKRPFQFSSDLQLGQREKLACIVVKGDGPFSFTWTKDRAVLGENSGLTKIVQMDEETSILRISAVEAEHVGNYTCSVAGPGGADTVVASLLINGRM